MINFKLAANPIPFSFECFAGTSVMSNPFPLSSATNGSKERIATETLYAIKDLQTELAIHVIGEAQKEQDNE